MEKTAKKDKKEKSQPPSYTFKYLLKARPSVSTIILTSSPLSSSLGLGAFPEASKIGTISCTKTVGNVKTTLSIATLYHSNAFLYINTNEKLRPEFSIDFIESLIAEGLFQGHAVIFDSICESEYVGDKRSRIKNIYSKAAGQASDLDPGNSLKGVVAAALIAGEVHGLNVRCIVGIPESYELNIENLRIFQTATEEISLNVNWLNGIHRYEQEKFKHQIYS